MADLEAALNKRNVILGHIRERPLSSSAMAGQCSAAYAAYDILEAYHGEAPEPEPEGKMEAGAMVEHKGIPGECGTILMVAANAGWIEWHAGNHRRVTYSKERLRIIAPAVVEVGDYVEHDVHGLAIVTALPRENISTFAMRDCKGNLIEVNRSEFTILMKAPKKGEADG